MYNSIFNHKTNKNEATVLIQIWIIVSQYADMKQVVS